MSGLLDLPSLPLPAPPPPEWVMKDLPCRSCGYNLRTLSIDGICPECATPVRVSMRGDLLREADPIWLWWLNAACKLIIAGMVFMLFPFIWRLRAIFTFLTLAG